MNKEELAYLSSVKDLVSSSSGNVIRNYQVASGQNIMAGDVVDIVNDKIEKEIVTYPPTYYKVNSNFTSYVKFLKIDDSRFVAIMNTNDSYNGQYLELVVIDAKTGMPIGSKVATSNSDRYINYDSFYVWKISDTYFCVVTYGGSGTRIYYYLFSIDGNTITQETYSGIINSSEYCFSIFPIGDRNLFIINPTGYSEFIRYMTLTYTSPKSITDYTGFNVVTISSRTKWAKSIMVSHSGNIYKFITFRIITGDSSSPHGYFYYFYTTLNTNGSEVTSDWTITTGEDTDFSDSIQGEYSSFELTKLNDGTVILAALTVGNTNNNIPQKLKVYSLNITDTQVTVTGSVDEPDMGTVSIDVLNLSTDGTNAYVLYCAQSQKFYLKKLVITDGEIKGFGISYLFDNDISAEISTSSYKGGGVYVDGDNLYCILGFQYNAASLGAWFTVYNNEFVGTYAVNSKEAIALEDGSAGSNIDVIYSGMTDFPGIAKGQAIQSIGVIGHAIFDNVLYVEPYWRGSRYETGTYTGTGTYGSGNQTRIELPFIPDMVFITADDDYTPTMKPWFNGQSIIMAFEPSSYTYTMPVVISDTTMTFYSDSASRQFNTSDKTYRWVAIKF